MAIATGIIVGLLIAGFGSIIFQLLGFALVGLSEHIKPDRGRQSFRRGLGRGVLAVLAVLCLFAGPLLSIWMAIVAGLQIAGV